MDNTIIAKTEAYIWMLNGLLASYGRYADDEGIDLSNNTSDFGKIYYAIVEEERKIRFYNTAEALDNCKKLIDKAKIKLEELGGSYLG